MRWKLNSKEFNNVEFRGRETNQHAVLASVRRHFKEDPAPAIPTDVIHNNPVFRSSAPAADLAVVVFSFDYFGRKY